MPLIHLQRTVPGWLDAVARMPDESIVKATEDWQVFREVKGVNPSISTVLRLVRDGWQNYDGQWFDWDVAKNQARLWFNAFIDQTFFADIARYCDAVSWHNEIWANSQTAAEQEERIIASEAAVAVWNGEYRHLFNNDIQLIIGEAAVGNWMPRRIAELAIDTDNLIGYHPYDYWRNKVRADEGFIVATSMLWDAMEYDWGLSPNWIFTEAGPFESAVTGWRSPICLDHDRTAYIDAVRTWIRDVQQTPAYDEGRIKGFALFTTGGGGKWEGFETSMPELGDLADMCRVEWRPGTSPPPPPPSDIDPELHRHLWWISIDYQSISLNTDAAIQRAIVADGFFPVEKELGTNWDGLIYRFQAAEHPTNYERRVYYAEYGDWDNVQWVGDPGVDTPHSIFTLGSPVDDIELYVTSPFGVPRDYDGDGIKESLHGGIDLRVLDDNGVPVPIIAAEDGQVIWASNLRRSNGQPSKLGNHVIIQHDNGLITWYGHMESITTQVGHDIFMGDMLGIGGNTGYVIPAPTPSNPRAGSHLHFTVQHPGHGINDPRYKFSDVVDPAPLLGL